MSEAAAPISSADRLSFTLFLAAAIHAVVILGVGFAPPATSDVSRTLEITLAHQRSDQAPEEADFLAQANQLASGDLDEKRELTTTEHTPFDSQSDNAVNLQAPSTRQADLRAPQKVLITTQGVSSRKAPAQRQETVEARPLPVSNLDSLAVLSEEIASLQARLDRERQAYAQRPRVLHLSSVSARQHDEAQYWDNFRRAVEETGTRHFPERAIREKTFGQVQLAVRLMPDGSLEKVEVTQTSGHGFLDEAAMQSVRLAAPFAPFPPEIRQKADRMEIIRTWRFDAKRQLSSQ